MRITPPIPPEPSDLEFHKVRNRQLLANWWYLAFTAWREARGEPRATKLGVMHVILNRVERPTWWGTSIEEVATKRFQFSALTLPGDPNLVKWPLLADASWAECIDVAQEVLDGMTSHPAPGADSYYDISLEPDNVPSWAAAARFCGQLGRIKFFDVDHDFEVP